MIPLFLSSGIHMRRVKLKCQNCGYEITVLEGSTEPKQTFSDLNEDFAVYQLFLCPEDKNIESHNIVDRAFDGKCASKASDLEKLEKLPDHCPRCNKLLETTILSVLEQNNK